MISSRVFAFLLLLLFVLPASLVRAAVEPDRARPCCGEKIAGQPCGGCAETAGERSKCCVATAFPLFFSKNAVGIAVSFTTSRDVAPDLAGEARTEPPSLPPPRVA